MVSDDYRALIERAEWSDRFFNFDDAQYADGTDDATFDADLHDAAKAFIAAWPSCPYDEQWLVDDYKGRL